MQQPIRPLTHTTSVLVTESDAETAAMALVVDRPPLIIVLAGEEGATGEVAGLGQDREAFERLPGLKGIVGLGVKHAFRLCWAIHVAGRQPPRRDQEFFADRTRVDAAGGRRIRAIEAPISMVWFMRIRTSIGTRLPERRPSVPRCVHASCREIHHG